jgi:hypothetical protein
MSDRRHLIEWTYPQEDETALTMMARGQAAKIYDQRYASVIDQDTFIKAWEKVEVSSSATRVFQVLEEIYGRKLNNVWKLGFLFRLWNRNGFHLLMNKEEERRHFIYVRNENNIDTLDHEITHFFDLEFGLVSRENGYEDIIAGIDLTRTLKQLSLGFSAILYLGARMRFAEHGVPDLTANADAALFAIGVLALLREKILIRQYLKSEIEVSARK